MPHSVTMPYCYGQRETTETQARQDDKWLRTSETKVWAVPPGKEQDLLSEVLAKGQGNAEWVKEGSYKHQL